MKPNNLLQNYKDIPDSLPITIKRILRKEDGQKKFDIKINQVKKSIKNGLTITQAISKVFNVSIMTAFNWQRHAESEMEKGKTDTPLLRLFNASYHAEGILLEKLTCKRLDKIFEEDNETLLRDAIKDYGKLPDKKEVDVNFKPKDTFKVLLSAKTDDDSDESKNERERL